MIHTLAHAAWGCQCVWARRSRPGLRVWTSPACGASTSECGATLYSARRASDTNIICRGPLPVPALITATVPPGTPARRSGPRPGGRHSVADAHARGRTRGVGQRHCRRRGRSGPREVRQCRRGRRHGTVRATIRSGARVRGSGRRLGHGHRRWCQRIRRHRTRGGTAAAAATAVVAAALNAVPAFWAELVAAFQSIAALGAEFRPMPAAATATWAAQWVHSAELVGAVVRGAGREGAALMAAAVATGTSEASEADRASFIGGRIRAIAIGARIGVAAAAARPPSSPSAARRPCRSGRAGYPTRSPARTWRWSRARPRTR